MEEEAHIQTSFSGLDWALVVPMANEEPDFPPFYQALNNALNAIGSGRVYWVVDSVSKDKTLALCEEVSLADPRYITLFRPENRNVVDAYLAGYKEAYKNGHSFIIEMDAGLSHAPDSLFRFLGLLSSGKWDAVLGSRFMKGGKLEDANPKRTFLSQGGTFVSNLLLGTRLTDMTSGYQGFKRDLVGKFLAFPLKSEGHFYQTELRYLIRKHKVVEIPISYRAPSPRVSSKSIKNAVLTLLYYFNRRLLLNPAKI